MDPRRDTLSYRVGVSLAAAAGGLLMWVMWQLPLSFAFNMEPPVAAAWMAALAAAFVWLYVFPPRLRARARSRVRPLGRSWLWVALTAPAMVGLSLGMWSALLALGLAKDTEYAEAVREFLDKPGGEWAFLLLAVAVAPLVEEFAFRGWIQRPMERRLGPTVAIGLTAVLFSAAHFEADAFPVRVAAGLVFGHAVYATRSVWAGVALHVAWNAGLVAVSEIAPDFDPTGKGWRWALPAAAVALVSLVWCAWGVSKMQDETGRARPAGGTAARGRPVESS